MGGWVTYQFVLEVVLGVVDEEIHDGLGHHVHEVLPHHVEVRGGQGLLGRERRVGGWVSHNELLLSYYSG